MFNVELLTQLCHLQEDRACVYFPPRSQHHCGSQKVLNKYLLNKINYHFEIAQVENNNILSLSKYIISYHLQKNLFLGKKKKPLFCWSQNDVLSWKCCDPAEDTALVLPLSPSFLLCKTGVTSLSNLF